MLGSGPHGMFSACLCLSRNQQPIAEQNTRPAGSATLLFASVALYHPEGLAIVNPAYPWLIRCEGMAARQTDRLHIRDLYDLDFPLRLYLRSDQCRPVFSACMRSGVLLHQSFSNLLCNPRASLSEHSAYACWNLDNPRFVLRVRGAPSFQRVSEGPSASQMDVVMVSARLFRPFSDSDTAHSVSVRNKYPFLFALIVLAPIFAAWIWSVERFSQIDGSWIHGWQSQLNFGQVWCSQIPRVYFKLD
jgi:hypothetical protein